MRPVIELKCPRPKYWANIMLPRMFRPPDAVPQAMAMAKATIAKRTPGKRELSARENALAAADLWKNFTLTELNFWTDGL